jgi:antitoxin component YwqK of YwqJK toxin-antitoxin module
MKAIITSILLLGLAQQVSANSFFKQLCEFNPNWKKYETRILDKEAIEFTSEVEYIQTHLTTVLSILRSNPTDHLNATQLNSRLHLIEVLNDYRLAGRFPLNYYRNERTPVFIDEHNTHCAVGFLIRETGYESLALDIAAANNYVWVKDITDARVIQWQKASGFTLEELKIIQGAYDSYMPNAFIAPNRYEIPQKPACATAYFEDETSGKELPHTKENVWFYGDGKYGKLNGRWEQNYAVGIPWIVGYYSNGKRTGQWKEYYQGTDILCRTENWRDDELNGVRIRFDREGVIIEEILFKDGDAVTKTNYDRVEGTKSIRTPLDSELLYNETYTLAGRLLATGNERVHNPGNLLWFQNIELTALNSVAISARSFEQNDNSELIPTLGNGRFGGSLSRNLFQTPPLVEYKKEGKWKFYGDSDQSLAMDYRSLTFSNRIKVDFQYFGKELSVLTEAMDEAGVKSQFDSLIIHYDNNVVFDFIGYGEKEYKHVHFVYYDSNPWTPELDSYHLVSDYFNGPEFSPAPLLSEVGEYNAKGYRIGEWKHYDKFQNLFKVENYLMPHKEEELVLGKMK